MNKIKAIFCEDKIEPYIIIRYPNASYKYSGMELGELMQLKKLIKNKSFLLKKLKNSNYIIEKMHLNI
jgi:hypothetical protein